MALYEVFPLAFWNSPCPGCATTAASQVRDGMLGMHEMAMESAEGVQQSERADTRPDAVSLHIVSFQAGCGLSFRCPLWCPCSSSGRCSSRYGAFLPSAFGSAARDPSRRVLQSAGRQAGSEPAPAAAKDAKLVRAQQARLMVLCSRLSWLTAERAV
jgi:hypothetical protein